MLGLLLEITTSPATEIGAVDFTWLFLKMMAALVVVCVIAVFVLKYAVPKIGFIKKIGGSHNIEIMARHNLDHRKQLYIVKVGSKYMLLGAGDHSVNFLMELNESDLKEVK